MNTKENNEISQKFEPIVFVNNPISSSKDDVIGFDSQIDTLLCAINNDANMIGIIADYGTGKSSMTELLSEAAEKTNKNKPIKINMWDCLSKIANNSDSEGVSALTKSFLYQLANGHSNKFGRYINKILSKNYGNISFSVNNSVRFIVFFLIAGLLYAFYKVLSINGTGVMQYFPEWDKCALILKICSPVFLIASISAALLGLKDTFIAFSHWKMPSKREPEISDVYDTYSIIKEKIVPKKGKQLVFIDDLDRIDKKNLIVEFLKELYRFQDTLDKDKEKIVFIISIKPESHLQNELKEEKEGSEETKENEENSNIYSKIFDITLSLKPIHFDDYDSLLLKLIKSNPKQKEKLEQLLECTFEEKLPPEFVWIKKGTNLTLRNMKDRLNQAIAILIALKNKNYKVKTSAKFKSCAAVAYLENQYQQDYYNLIKHEAEFSKFMQSTRLIIDEKTNDNKFPQLNETFSDCFKQEDVEETFSQDFVEDFCDMILSGVFDDDYRMYFYTYPKGSPIKTTDERTLCDYILLPNSHSQHDRLDDLVSRVFEKGENAIIKDAISSIDVEFPTILIENDTLFVMSAEVNFEKTFATFSKVIIKSNYDEDYKSHFWKRLSLLPEALYKRFVSASIKDVISVCSEEEQLLALRKSIVKGLTDKILDFKDLYNSKFEYIPQITNEEIEIINSLNVSLELIDIDKLSEDNYDRLVGIINESDLKSVSSKSFQIALMIWKKYVTIILPDKCGNNLLEFLFNNKHMDDDFFEIVVDAPISLDKIAQYLNLFSPEQFTKRYLELIDQIGFTELIGEKLISCLLNNSFFYTPLLFCATQNSMSLLDEYLDNTKQILSASKTILNTSPQSILVVRNYLYYIKKLNEYKVLYFDPYPLINEDELLQIEDAIEAIHLIDTTLISEANYALLTKSIHNKHFESNDLLALFEWLFDEDSNENCVTDESVKKSIFDSLDFGLLNIKALNEAQREKIKELFDDIFNSGVPENAIELLKKFMCLIPSIEESACTNEDLYESYSHLIAEFDEFSTYTLKWLDKHYIQCGLSEKLCKILYDKKDYQNYIIADCLRKNNMVIDADIPLKEYISVYINVDEMFDLMSGHWNFLEQLQVHADLSKLDEKHLTPIFKTNQTERFFTYIFSDKTDDSIKENYLCKFGKFKTENDSKAFQRLICQTHNMELLGSYDLYHKIHRNLWESNSSHKRLFTKAWNTRWKKELDDKILTTLD